MSVKKNLWSHVQKCVILILCKNPSPRRIRTWQRKRTAATELSQRLVRQLISAILINFVEVKVRMTPEHRTEVQQHAQEMGESTTAFINRAIDETMERDKEAKKK